MISAKRIATRYIRARETQPFIKAKAMLFALNSRLEEAEDALMAIRRKPTAVQDPGYLEDIAVRLSAQAKLCRQGLVAHSDSVWLESEFRKSKALKGFLAILGQLAKVKTWDVLQNILNDQIEQSGGHRPSSLFQDYAIDYLGFINQESPEVEDTLQVGRFRVRLLTNKGADWDRDLVDDLKWKFEAAAKAVQGAGCGFLADLPVIAYATEDLSNAAAGAGGPNVAASYSAEQDSLSFAAKTQAGWEAIVHELGHRLYFKTIGSEGREQWTQFFGQNVTPVSADKIIKDWTAFAKKRTNGQFYSEYGPYLEATDTEASMWLEIVAQKVNLQLDMTDDDEPVPGRLPGLNWLKKNKAKAQAFLYPVSAYSATSPEELFAETFRFLIVKGPGRIPPIVLHAFHLAAPMVTI